MPAGRVTCNVLPAPPVYASTANDWCLTQDVDERQPAARRSRLGARPRRRSRQGRGAPVDSLPDLDQLRPAGDAGADQADVAGDRRGDRAAQHQRLGVLRQRSRRARTPTRSSTPTSRCTPTTFDGTDPQAFMAGWVCEEIPGPENQWLGSNIARYCSAAYDALAAELAEDGGDRAACGDRQAHERPVDRGRSHGPADRSWRGRRTVAFASAASGTTSGTRPCGTSTSGTAVSERTSLAE